MFEIIRTESCPKQNQTLFEKSSIPWTHCFRQKNSTSCQKVQDLKDLKSPENKRDVMRVLGSLGFYSTFIKNLHVDSKPFYELLRDDVPFKWTKEHEKLFQNLKDRISEETILAVPNPKYPFNIHVDSSSIGTGSILVQECPSGKL